MTEARSAIDVIHNLCVRFADRDCFADRVPTNDDSIAFRTITFRRLWERAVALASALSHRDLVHHNERVLICGDGSIDWVVADIACIYAGAASVAVSANQPTEDLEHIVGETAPVLFICSPTALPVVLKLAPHAKSLRGLVLIDAEGDVATGGLPTWHIDELEATPCPTRPPVIRRGDEVFTIVYTSGGTGRPKGVPTADGFWRRGLVLPVQDGIEIATVCYLPLNHIMARGVVFNALALGGTGYFFPAQDLSLLWRAIRVVRPTFLQLIPTVSNFLYQQYRALVAARVPAGADAATVKRCEQAVLAELRCTMLGDRLLNIRVGSAPTAPEVRRFLDNLSPVVMDFYASSELGIVAINGRILRDIQYRLEDAPELGYTRADKPHPRGELLIKSPRAAKRYYNRPDFVEADGFVRTGDIFEERGPQQVVWIDRRSTVMKLAQGEFVALSRIEHLFMSGCHHVRQMFLYGNSQRDHLLAVIVPRETDPAVVETAAYKQLLRVDLEQAARAAHLRGHEIPRDFIVEPEPFSVENRLLTDAGKLRRPALKIKYEAALEALYKNIDDRRAGAARSAEPATTRDGVIAAAASALGLPPGDLDAETSFVALGGDSLAAVRVATHLEGLLGRAPSVGAILDRNVTLAELARRLEREANGPRFDAIHPDGQREVRADELRLDRFLAAELAAVRQPAVDEPRTILLTGGNGFLGRTLLLELLQQLAARAGRVVALVRASDDATARARIVAALAVSGEEAVDRFERLARDRLVVHAGDLTRPRLGLAAADYETLAESVDAIVHNGALVNHALGYRQLFEPNVVGTIEVLRLALHKRLKPVSFISSIAVAAGLRRTAPIGEDEDAAALWPRRPTGAADAVPGFGYGTSKWAGELLVREFGARTGAGVTLFRCGSLLAHSTLRRQINEADATMRLVADVASTGLAPRSFFAAGHADPRALEAVPVDRAAALIAALALQPRAEPRLYHLTRRLQPNALSLDDVVDVLERAGRIRLRAVRYEDWYSALRDALSRLGKEEQRRSALPILERWRQPIAAALKLDTQRLDRELERLTGASEFPPLVEADVLRWLEDLDALDQPSSG